MPITTMTSPAAESAPPTWSGWLVRSGGRGSLILRARKRITAMISAWKTKAALQLMAVVMRPARLQMSSGGSRPGWFRHIQSLCVARALEGPANAWRTPYGRRTRSTRGGKSRAHRRGRTKGVASTHCLTARDHGTVGTSSSRRLLCLLQKGSGQPPCLRRGRLELSVESELNCAERRRGSRSCSREPG